MISGADGGKAVICSVYLQYILETTISVMQAYGKVLPRLLMQQSNTEVLPVDMTSS